MADLTVAIALGSGMCAVLAVAAGIPHRLADWIDARVLAPKSDDPAVQGRAVQTSHDS